jgi:hypothetical protein
MKPGTDEPKESILKEVAKAVGKATGTVASLVATHPEAPQTPEPKRTGGKLPKKHKSRTPRRVKKAMKKQAVSR